MGRLCYGCRNGRRARSRAGAEARRGCPKVADGRGAGLRSPRILRAASNPRRRSPTAAKRPRAPLPPPGPRRFRPAKVYLAPEDRLTIRPVGLLARFIKNGQRARNPHDLAIDFVKAEMAFHPSGDRVRRKRLVAGTRRNASLDGSAQIGSVRIRVAIGRRPKRFRNDIAGIDRDAEQSACDPGDRSVASFSGPSEAIVAEVPMHSRRSLNRSRTRRTSMATSAPAARGRCAARPAPGTAARRRGCEPPCRSPGTAS